MYVKNSDTAEALETILYDPGVGRRLVSPEIFKGWHIVTESEPDYSASTTPKTIEGVRDYFADLTEANTIKEGDEITIQAMIFKAYTITYQDENGTTIESATALTKGDSPADFTANMSYVPPDPDQQFQGWSTRQNLKLNIRERR